MPVLFDSGIRSGTHVIKALAMGAAAVGVGRPYAYGLALGGTDGIVHLLRSLLAEADLLIAVNGLPTRATHAQGVAARGTMTKERSAPGIEDFPDPRSLGFRPSALRDSATAHRRR